MIAYTPPPLLDVLTQCQAATNKILETVVQAQQYDEIASLAQNLMIVGDSRLPHKQALGGAAVKVMESLSGAVRGFEIMKTALVKLDELERQNEAKG